MRLFDRGFKKFCDILLPALLGLFVFYNISYTDDIDAYYASYNGDEIGDYGYKLLEGIGNCLNFDFLQFENSIFFLILILFSIVFYLYRVNTYLGIFLTILLNYVQIANQLRYFLAVPVLLLSFYYFFIAHKKIFGIILSIVAFSLHSGVIAWMSFIPLTIWLESRHIGYNKLLKIYLVIGVVVLMTFATLSKYLFSIDQKYESYTADMSSWLGTVFILAYPVCCIVVVRYCYKTYGTKILATKINSLAYSMSLFSVVWCIASLSKYQVINARYVNAFFATWIIAMYSKNEQFRFPLKLLLLFAISAIFLKQILPILLFGYETSDIYKATLIWQSKFVNLLL